MYDDASPSNHRCVHRPGLLTTLLSVLIPALLRSVVPQYDVTTIRVPIAVFTGGRDTVIDPSRLIGMLPPSTVVHHEEDYEHLDFLWADSAKDRVFPLITEFLKRHMSRDYGEESLSASLRIAPRMMAYSM
jgi:hypothetical protein